MRIRRSIARAGWALSGWKHVSEPLPDDSVRVLIGAPHTSNWDFIFMLGILWDLEINAKYLGKHTLFKRPFGPLMRALGGIPVDRRNPAGIVDDVVARVKDGQHFSLVVTPEGTRAKGAYWKSGFYRIAVEAGLPITLGYVDRPSKTSGLGLTFVPSGDVRADMDIVRAYYADKTGYSPDKRTEPRLREEDR